MKYYIEKRVETYVEIIDENYAGFRVLEMGLALEVKYCPIKKDIDLHIMQQDHPRYKEIRDLGLACISGKLTEVVNE